jgi:hypothetical protein
MALSRTNLLGQITSGNFGTGNFTSSSFTPSSSSLLVVGVAYVENNGTTTDPTSALTISGGGLTWTQQATAVAAPTAFPSLVKIWTAPVTTGSSMTVTLSTSGRTAGLYGVSVVCYTGYNTGTPVGGTGGNSQNGGFTGPPDPATVTLSAAPAAGDEAFGFVFADKVTANISPGSAVTEIDDLNNTNWGSLESEIRTGSTSTTVDWVDLRPGGSSLFNYAAAAIVIKVASAAAATYPPMQQARRRTQPPPRRARASTPVRAQVNPPFPFTGIKQPRRLRGLLARRGEMFTPVPAQVVVNAPAYPVRPVRTRLRGLRIFRGRAAVPLPAQTIVTPPAYIPAAIRPRLKWLRLFRPRTATPVAEQVAVLTAPHVRPHPMAPRRGRAAMPPPQIVVTPPAYPPRPVRSRLKGLRLARPRAAMPVPQQVVIVPPAYVPVLARFKRRIAGLFRGQTVTPVAEVCDCTTHRPNLGTTARPGSGMTVRPDSGTTARPCSCND